MSSPSFTAKTAVDELAELDATTIRSHLNDADPAVLLAALVQVTGETELLDRYNPEISHDADPPEMVGRAPDHVRSAIIDRFTRIIASGDAARAHRRAVDPAVFSRLAPLALGTPVDDEFIPMLLDQGGFQEPHPVVPRTGPLPGSTSVAVIGAGLAGIAAAVRAQAMGVPYTVFEREHGVGGTWRTQIYPGVGVDTPAAYYSYSFELSPDWTNYYPSGDEYHAYLDRVVDKHGIREQIRFGTEVESLAWNESRHQWRITVVDSSTDTRSVSYARTVITAVGYLNRPKFPDVKGRETFAGISVHSGEWDHSLDVAGKRVAVVGAGCTAAQLVDAIAPSVEHLTLYQRQPHWVGRRRREDDSVPAHKKWLLAHVPYYAEWCRTKAFWAAADNLYPVIRVDPEWAAEHRSISRANDVLMRDCLSYISDTFGADSDLARKVTPDFPPFGKRIIRDPGNYYQALNQPNVDVVTSELSRVTPDGIVTADGQFTEVDVIIYATGFTLDFLSQFDIRGRDGVRLVDEWANNNPRSYLGGTVPGFPNLFVTSAPNSSQGHGAGQNFGVECFVHYIGECLQLMAERGATSLEPTREAYEAHTARVDAAMESTIWRNAPTAHTYYKNQAGRVILPWPWRLVDLWNELRAPREADYILR